MNLVKNGTVLLAALSVFALSSCNNGKTISFEEAKAWFDKHYSEDEKILSVKEGTYNWDYTKSSGDSFVKEGAPRLISYLITQKQAQLINPLEVSKEKSKKNYVYDFGGSRQINAHNGEKFEKYIKDNADGEKPTKCVLKGKKLYVTFKHVEGLPTSTGDEYPFPMIETDVFYEDTMCHMATVKLSGEEVDYPGFEMLGVPAFKGVAKGSITFEYTSFME